MPKGPRGPKTTRDRLRAAAHTNATWRLGQELRGTHRQRFDELYAEECAKRDVPTIKAS